MRNIFLWIGILSVLSCNHKEKYNNSKVEPVKEKTIVEPILATKIPKEYSLLNKESYDAIFLAKAEHTNDDYFQILGINWISEKEIAYTLLYENQLCTGECEGRATRQDSKIHKEINSYERDSEFRFLKFIDQKENFDVIIKIEATHRDQLEIEFQFSNDSDCGPYEAMMIS